MRRTVSIALAGSGGAGVMTAGALLMRAAARAGYYGMFLRMFGAQVRGGEAAALITLGTAPIESPPDAYDALVAIDWGNVERFADSIPLVPTSALLCDPRHGATPAAIVAAAARRVEVPFSALARVQGGRPNIVACGVLAELLGLPSDLVEDAAARQLAPIGAQAVAGGRACLAAGRQAGVSSGIDLRLAPPAAAEKKRWLITGNQALALGALRGGVRFVAGYPITPATEVAEWLAPTMARIGGVFAQAEDELAALNFCLGSSYGGIPAMTVTSGPGFSLMVETIGLAVAAEIPVVIIDVQRCGPSTGIASKTEQADLNLALYGVHGEAPHVVVAPTSAADGLATARWAVELAEYLQCPAIVLSDQQMGQAEVVIDASPDPAPPAKRVLAEVRTGERYKRYALTESGLSPISIPGTPGMAWIGESLTHTESSAASSSARDHMEQIEKRARKLRTYDFGPRWGEVEGEGESAVIAWGSAVAPAREAIARSGGAIRLIAPRLLAPFPEQGFARALAGVKRALVVEQNHSGQLYRYLRSQVEVPVAFSSCARPGPLPFRPRELATKIAAWSRT